MPSILMFEILRLSTSTFLGKRVSKEKEKGEKEKEKAGKGNEGEREREGRKG